MARRHETFLRVKSAESSDGERWITAWATTPDEDLCGDVVSPTGAVYQLPIPLLAFHKHDCPVGVVTEAHVSERGIRIRAKLSKGVQLAEELWNLVLDGAVAAVSIGFTSLKSKPMPSGGLLFESWRWIELSLTPVPCNSNARIISVGKSIAYATEVEPIRVPAPAEAKKVTPQQAEAKAYELGGDEWQAMEAGIKAACDLLPAEVRGMVCAERSGRSPTTRDYTLSDREGREVATVKATGEVTRPGQPDKPKPPVQSGLTRAQRAEVVRLLDEVVAGVGRGVGQVMKESDAKLAQAIVKLADKVDRLEETALHDAGIYKAGQTYGRGALVVHDGGTYIATADNDAEPGRGATGWRLIGRKTA